MACLPDALASLAEPLASLAKSFQSAWFSYVLLPKTPKPHQLHLMQILDVIN